MSDWDTVTKIGSKVRPSGGGGGGGGPTALERAKAVGAVTEQGRKNAAGRNAGHVGTDHQKLAALDRDSEPAPPKAVSMSVGKAIQQARQAAGMSQSDLAKQINEKPTVIGDFEASRVPPNPQVLGKLERALKVKLRGKDVGAPLAGPGKKK